MEREIDGITDVQPDAMAEPQSQKMPAEGSACESHADGGGSAERVEQLKNENLKVQLEIERERSRSAQARAEEERHRQKDKEREDRRERDRIKREDRRERAERSRERTALVGKVVGSLPSIAKLAIVAGVVIAVLGCVVGYNVYTTSTQPTEIVTISTLERVVNISDLSTARYTYNGIAEKKDDEGNVICHVYYEAYVDAGVDMAKISFAIDEESKTVYPTLPEITVHDPVVDSSSVDFFETNPSISLAEVIGICKKDALDEVRSSEQIIQTAEENLRSTVEALLTPLTKSEGYSISWDAPKPESEEVDNAEK